MKVTVHLWVDGSHVKETNTIGGGVVLQLFVGDKQVGDNYESVATDKDSSGMWNVAGELLAVTTGLNLLMKLVSSDANIEIKKVVIHYDYDGIAKWATDEWKTRRNATSEYKRTIQSAMKLYNIEFLKERAHTGVELNERADILAKQGAGILELEAKFRQVNEVI